MNRRSARMLWRHTVRSYISWWYPRRDRQWGAVPLRPDNFLSRRISFWDSFQFHTFWWPRCYILQGSGLSRKRWYFLKQILKHRLFLFFYFFFLLCYIYRYLHVYGFIFTCLSFYQPVCIYRAVRLSISLSTYISIIYLSLYLSIYS